MSAIDRDFALLVRHLLDVLERRDAREMARIRTELVGEASEARRSTEDSKRRTADQVEAEELRAQFAGFESRDELSRYIRDKYPSKADVESVARILRLTITKSDNTDALVDRIVASTVGYRLRSSAIRGEDDGRK